MFSFKTQKPFQSVRYPGVTCTINALTVERRARLDLAIAADPTREQYYDALIDRESLGDSTDKKSRFKRAALNERISALERRQTIGPTIRECVASIEGLEIDGEPATLESLIAQAPDDLLQEIVDFINYDMRLSSKERASFSPGSDSQEPADGPTPSTTAPSASETAGIDSATADSSPTTA